MAEEGRDKPDPGGDRGKIDGCSGGVVSSVSHSSCHSTKFPDAVGHEICVLGTVTALHAAMASADGANLCGLQCW